MAIVQIGDALVNSLLGKDDLGAHGKFMTSVHLGTEAFRSRMAAAGVAQGIIAERIEWAQGGIRAGLGLCESPIERSMLPALVFADYWVSQSMPADVHTNPSEALPEARVVIVPQHVVLNFRLDFAVVVRASKGRILVVAVECDGADYHDARRDADRDDVLASWGIPVVRLTGSRINTDPMECASHVASRVVHHIDRLGMRT